MENFAKYLFGSTIYLVTDHGNNDKYIRLMLVMNHELNDSINQPKSLRRRARQKIDEKFCNVRHTDWKSN